MSCLVLRLDVTGRPLEWISRERAAILYCRDEIAWEAGSTHLRLHGGRSRATGLQSYLDVSTIVASRGVARTGARIGHGPPLTNLRLFRRDGFLCMYCGGAFSRAALTRDHVQPTSRGGLDVWENVATACRRCNQRKGDRTLAEAERIGMRLLAVPYRPNEAEGLILGNRRILADQMAFLAARVGRAGRRRQV